MESTHSAVARSSRIWLAKTLCTLLILSGPLATVAHARDPVPGPLPDPGPAIAPGTATETLEFESYGTGLAVAGDNGFDLTVVNGEWRHRGHRHFGGTGAIASPWGEEMAVRYWTNPDGSFAVEFDGNAILHYTFDGLGALDNVTAVTETGVASAFAGRRAERAVLGLADPFALDLAPYESFLGQIARNHGRDFLDGARSLSRRFEAGGIAAPASCAIDVLACTAAILGWIATVPGIVAGCTAGSTVTLGASCLAAILGHEAASAGTLAACTNAILSCTDHEQYHDDPGDGCNGPGGEGPE